MDLAVDLGRVGLGTAGRAAFVIHGVDDDVDCPADLGLELAVEMAALFAMKRA